VDTYDLAGRRVGVGGSLASTQLPAAVSSAAYNANNQLTQWGSTAMTYDANGSTLSDGMNTYVWDARNRLVSADNNAAAFAYDPLGRRVSKTFMSTTTNFLYDGANAVQEFGTNPTANLLTGGVDERFMRTSATETDNYLTDALGSTVEQTGASGATEEQYIYSPYGSQSASGMTTTNSYAYTGREFDGLGVDYYRARYYNPTTGRFLSEDPMGFAGGINLYAYAKNNPVNFLDAFGLCSTLPPVPSPPDPVLGYSQCFNQVMKEAHRDELIFSIAVNVVYADLLAVALLLGPEGLVAVAVIEMLDVMLEITFFLAMQNKIYEEEERCMQQNP
jgi:RHS repeat-associated protein